MRTIWQLGTGKRNIETWLNQLSRTPFTQSYICSIWLEANLPLIFPISQESQTDLLEPNDNSVFVKCINTFFMSSLNLVQMFLFINLLEHDHRFTSVQTLHFFKNLKKKKNSIYINTTTAQQYTFHTFTLNSNTKKEKQTNKNPVLFQILILLQAWSNSRLVSLIKLVLCELITI